MIRTGSKTEESEGDSVDEGVDLVLDASIAIKWYVEEPRSDEALRFMSAAFRFHVPSFFMAECCNTIWKKVAQRKELSADTGQEILDDLLTYPRRVHDSDEIVPLAWDIALALGERKLAIYDFIYLALAVELDCRYVTADHVFYRALRGGPLEKHILWVSDPTDTVSP